MATANPFALLGDDDNDDPSQLIAAQQQKVAALPAKKPAAATAGAAAAKLPSKPAPPAQAVKDARSSTAPARGGGRGGLGRGRGSRGSGPDQNREYGNANLNGFSGGYGAAGVGGEDGEGKPLDRERGSYGGPRQPYRDGHRGGYGSGEAGAGGDYNRPPRRAFERRSGTGRGNETKREGSGRGNWGTPNDDVLAQETEVVNVDEKALATEKPPEEDVPTSETNKEVKEGAANENEEKEQEDKEMTLEEYEKIKEEKRKALLSMKSEERKADFDKDFLSMQQLSLKKGTDEIFIKLGSDKDSKGKDNVDRDERAKKSLSINEFLKPADGERYYTPGGRGRGRGRGRGDRGPPRGTFGGDYATAGVAAPVIDDPGHFPALGGKK